MTPPQDFEARLVARFQNGDVRALDTLFDLYADRALGLAVRLTETREDAEEVTQEAFIRAFRHARQWRGGSGTAAQEIGRGSFGPWLFAIVRNLASDRRRQLRLPTLSLSSPDAENVSDGLGAAEEAERRQERRDLLAALDSLPEEWRIVLTLCDLEDVPHSEAAQVLQKTTSATKSLLYRARRGLRDKLSEQWKEPSDDKR